MDFSFRSESIKMTFTVQNKEILQENHLLNILFYAFPRLLEWMVENMFLWQENSMS